MPTLPDDDSARDAPFATGCCPHLSHRISLMGLTHVTTTIRRLSGTGRGYTAEFLVDTGAVDCLAPGKALRKAGIQIEGRKIYELADGRPIEMEYGFARVQLMGEETVAP